MRTTFTSFVVALLLVLGVTRGTAYAQQVPVRGEDGWVLPENDDSFSMTSPSGGTIAAAPSTGAQTDNWYYETVVAAANHYGADAGRMWNLVGCETGGTYDPATGWNTGIDGSTPGTAYGPFQFEPATYAEFASLSGYGGSYENPTDQAYVAAWALSRGYAYRWRCAY